MSPNGVFLCADQHFASTVGIMEGELVGHTLSMLVADPQHVESLLQRCREASVEVLESGSIRAQLLLLHRYLDPVPVDVTVFMAGSDAQRILVLHCARTDGRDGAMLAVDAHMRIRFASCEVAALTGYTPRRLAAMKLDALLPPPHNVLHAKWLRDTPHVVPAGSCRSGAVVHLLADTGSQVPVTLQVRMVDVEAAAPGGAAGSTSVMHVVQVAKVPQDKLHADKRLLLTADFSGRVLAVSPPDSQVFDFPAAELLGTNLSDCIDLFDDWRQHSGDGQMQLLLLALLDKEAEMPGTSMRVKVRAPSSPGQELPPLPGQLKAPRKSRVACLQVDLIEGSGEDAGGDGDEGSSRVLVTLWRRDLLAGVLELDEELTVRRASPVTGLITGLPVTAMLRKPLGRLLHLPPAATSWESLVSACSQPGKKKSALKASSERGSISPLVALIGPHPDTGTMRLLLQGVQTLGPNGRPKTVLTVHPDATFVGAHADLMRVLKLDGAGAGHCSHADDPAASSAAAHAGLGAEHALDGDHARAASARLKSRSGRSGRSLAASRAASRRAPPDHEAEVPRGEEDGAAQAARGTVDAAGPPPSRGLHQHASSKSEFVEQWVKALTKQLDGPKEPMSPVPESASLEALLPQPGEHEAQGGEAVVATVHSLGADPEEEAEGKGLECRAVSSVKPWSSRQTSRDVPSSPPAAASGGKAGKGHGKAEEEEEDDKSDRTSENDASSVGDGSQAASAISGTSDATSATDAVVDARRGRLLKALNRMLLGPSLLGHVSRLHLHSYGLVAAMFVTHLIAYVIIARLISEQHGHVYEVLGQAMAMDRSQLILCRAVTGSFCTRPGVMPVSVCDRPLHTVMDRMRHAVDEMEQFHQGVYLGLTLKVKPPAAAVYDIWTSPKVTYNVFMDTTPPQAVELHAGAWTLGNRFIAAAREALFLLPEMTYNYMVHRTCLFMLMNGFGPLFEAYATSLDLLVGTAWTSVQRLQTVLIVLLVVEAVAVQLCCTLWELQLVQRLEAARLSGMLAMLGLPGPVLRQLVASDQRKIVEDSDDEAEENGSVAGEENDNGQGDPAAGSGRLPASGSADALPSILGAASGGAVGWDSSVPADKAARRNRAGSGMREDADSAQGTDEGDPKKQGRHLGGRTFKLGASSKASQQAANDPATHGSQRLHVNGKTLLPSHWNVGKFMAPFFVWNIAVVIMYSLSISKLRSMQGPLASLNMAAHVTYRYTRVRALSLGFLAEPLELRPLLRALLVNELDLFESEYDALMYGGTPISLMNSTFRQPAPAGTFESGAFAQKFFTSKGCLRYDQSACFTPESPYYEVTHNGLDVLVRRMVSEMRLLSMDADEDVAYNNSRYEFMAAVAGNDLYEGLQQATQLFVTFSIQRYDQVAGLHKVLLIVSVFLVFAFVGFLLWPHSRRTLRDASRQSGLLSLVPPEMDVRSHVRSVCKRAAGAARKN